jgi:hypothetical protein
MWKTALRATCLAASLLAPACQSPAPQSPAPRAAERGDRIRTIESSDRRKHFLKQGVPNHYRGKHNPLTATIGTMIEGARSYDLHCAQCHGVMGMGNGAAADQLEVGPADLDRSLGNPDYLDDFFYWSIAEGGARFATDMPAFKEDLSERQIWSVLSFMRATFIERRTARMRRNVKRRD